MQTSARQATISIIDQIISVTPGCNNIGKHIISCLDKAFVKHNKNNKHGKNVQKHSIVYNYLTDLKSYAVRL